MTEHMSHDFEIWRDSMRRRVTTQQGGGGFTTVLLNGSGAGDVLRGPDAAYGRQQWWPVSPHQAGMATDVIMSSCPPLTTQQEAVDALLNLTPEEYERLAAAGRLEW